MKNTLAVMVTSPPNSNLTTSAIHLISAAQRNGIKVIGVFFYQQGVLNAAAHLSIPNDEYQNQQQWQALKQQYNIPLYLCNTAAEKHGLSDDILLPSINEHATTTKNSNINEDFIIAGLGELATLTKQADRVLQL